MSTPRTLLLVRHAKSSWDDDRLEDRQRPLNDSGMLDAPEMAERIRQRLLIPGRIVSSPAVRAFDTASAMSRTLHLPPDQIQVEEDLYGALSSDILDVVRGIDVNIHVAMVITHNPGLTDLANQFTSQVIENVPTCGIVTIEMPSWEAVDDGTMVDFDYPKKSSETTSP